ncbi:MAG: hypothetical protein QW112_04020 [Candidatus Micrarchaeia archaeon]
MPVSVLKYKISNLTESILELIKGYTPKKVQRRVKRLMAEGTTKDLVFMQGVATGIELTKMDKKSIKRLIDILKAGIKRDEDGKDEILKKEELNEINEILKGRFNLNARNRICNTLASADAMMLEEFIGMLK